MFIQTKTRREKNNVQIVSVYKVQFFLFSIDTVELCTHNSDFHLAVHFEYKSQHEPTHTHTNNQLVFEKMPTKPTECP